MTLELQFLPARQGDAIWIRWGAADDRHQILIDLGIEGVGVAMRDRLARLPEAERHFDLLVVTHVDRDHIGGVLTCIADTDDPLPGLTFDDVWFNGWDHLHGRAAPAPRPGLEPMGPAQGERLAGWLRTTAWNERFGRGPVERGDTTFPVVDLPAGLRLTVLGPTRTRLEQLAPVWKEEVAKALAKGSLDEEDIDDDLRDELHPGLERLGARNKTAPVLEDWVDLEELAATTTKIDDKEANGSSISLLAEWGDITMLLAGDAWATDVVASLRDHFGGEPPAIDVVKLPHHGSEKNVTDELIGAIDSPRWVFSTDGSTYQHPDAIAVARVIVGRAGKPVTLGFNVPSDYNRWWDRDDWRDRFDYQTEYGTPEDGLTLVFDDRDADGRAAPDPASAPADRAPNAPEHDPESTGRIRVDFEGPSYFLQASMPHEVRDHALRIVARGAGPHTYTDLPPGLYLVEGIDTGGSRRSEMVEVVGGETRPVTFSAVTATSPAYATPTTKYPSGEEIDAAGGRGTSPGDDPAQWTRQLHSMLPTDRDDHEVELEFAPSGASSVEVVETVECGIVDRSDDRFVFAPVGTLAQTPRAILAVDGVLHDLCLPIHDRGDYPLNAALVVIERRRSGVRRPVARFAPERHVASALDRMLGTGAILDADELFGEASSLLFHKYSDPPAAALGALTMFRLGRLPERADWVHNLARGFPWLPDGAAVYAALLRDSDDPDRRMEGLELLLGAAARRPMFTDGLSIMMQLLRRWPTDDRLDERRSLLRELAPRAAGADLDATCLSVTVSDELLA